MWKFIKDGNTVSFFLTGYGSLYETYRGFQTLYIDVEVYKRRIHCFIPCNWMWKFIKDGNTVSFFLTGYGSLYETYRGFQTLYMDVEVYKRRIVSYFVTGVGIS